MITNGTIIDTVSEIGVIAGPLQQGRIFKDWETVAKSANGGEYVPGGTMIDALVRTILTGPPPGVNFAAVKKQILSICGAAGLESLVTTPQGPRTIHRQAQEQGTQEAATDDIDKEDEDA